MSDDFLSNLQSLTTNMNDIAFSRYATITKVNEDNTVDCKEDNGTVHKNVINGADVKLEIDDTAILGFVDNNIYNPIITGVTSTNSNKLYTSDIIDNLTSEDSTKPLSAKQGKILNDLIGNIEEDMLL